MKNEELLSVCAQSERKTLFKFDKDFLPKAKSLPQFLILNF